MDPGLRPERETITPASLARRTSGTRQVFPALPPAAAKTKPARSGPARRKNEPLRPDATLTLAAERQVACVDDVFAALDEAGRHLGKDDLMRLEPSDVVPGANGQARQPRIEEQIGT
jgi:hypothetical protein